MELDWSATFKLFGLDIGSTTYDVVDAVAAADEQDRIRCMAIAGVLERRRREARERDC